MPRRHQVRMACQRCRRKRAKCDGEDPCERCTETGFECTFDHSRRESKDDLRAEIGRLRRIIERSDALLDALSSMDDASAYQMVVQGLMDGTVTRQSIFDDLPGHLKIAGAPEPSGPPRAVASSLRCDSKDTSSVGGSSTDARSTMCPRCRCALSVTSTVADSDEFSERISEHHASADAQSESNWLATPSSTAGSVLSLPSLSREEKMQRTDPWTRTGWSAAKIKDHLEVLLTWDYLPFCLLRQDIFLQDFISGDGRYCSPALVNSLLALSTRIVGEQTPYGQQQQQQQQQEGYLANTVDSGSRSSGWSDGQALFDEAEALVSGQGQPNRLPDIQALGMLALYQVSRGREAEARELAEAFAVAITELCLREPLDAEEQDGQFALVRATTYCGAISLVRILKLMTSQPSGMRAAMMVADGVALDQPPPCANGSNEPPVISVEPRTLAGEHRSQLSSLQLIPAKIFQLTEWVYTILASSPTATEDEVVLVYHQCLNWYESFFALQTDGSNSPFVLFIHMYYQFCLLSLFRPRVGKPIEGLGVHPREICLQAAQSILGLLQSYAGLFGLHRVAPLVQYFVCASASLSLAIEEAG
ncbi:hypothetical protein JDV02_004171 [Purpureocillium takamizusanense]|uniref:Zn(2)-C6 fungal-type domain-containing protein n=1 Tax=Purpureocillium takamizusanense TaxID=2060973 RepID=A0A9Q8QFR0_9HYPO|nr:uncharacterized protein JDV02_004171 [Purpureocillium takamizusanense]UNI17857.1 hypothetical protein JDV02_004171 [Purpureocillium takamizusanense]